MVHGQGRLSGQRNNDVRKMDKASEKELQRIQTLAEKGDVEKAWWLGRTYDPSVPLPHGGKYDPRWQKKNQPYFFQVTKSYSDALHWYEIAAKGGYGSAQSVLGDLYFADDKRGEVFFHDYEKAVFWYTKAIVEPSTPAKWRLGDMSSLAWLYHNFGAARNDQKALELWFKAAQGGEPTSQFNIGLFYKLGGLGLPADSLNACKWFFLAADNGYKDAESELSSLENSLAPEQVSALNEYRNAVALRRQQAAERIRESRETRVPEVAAEDDEPVPSTAAIIAEALGNVAGQVGQMRRDQAQAAEDLRRLKQQQQTDAQRQQQAQLDAQRRVNDQAARQETERLEGYRQEAARLEQEALANRAREQQAGAQQIAQAIYHNQCIQSEVKRGAFCSGTESTSAELTNTCSMTLDTRWCYERKDGSWNCYAATAATSPLAAGASPGASWTCSGTGRMLIWAREPGSSQPWPKTPGPER